MAILPKKKKKVVQDLFLEFLEYSYIHITDCSHCLVLAALLLQVNEAK